MNTVENVAQSILMERIRMALPKNFVISLTQKMKAAVAAAVPDMTDAIMTAVVTDVPAVLLQADVLMPWTEEAALTGAL